MAVREMLGDWRWVYFGGERMPMVMWVLGRAERCGRKAVPSSPAPSRRICVWGEVIMEERLMVCYASRLRWMLS